MLYSTTPLLSVSSHFLSFDARAQARKPLARALGIRIFDGFYLSVITLGPLNGFLPGAGDASALVWL